MVVPELNCCALDSFRLFTVSSPQIQEDPFKCRATPAARIESPSPTEDFSASNKAKVVSAGETPGTTTAAAS
jgi:hypothetical protein